MPPSPKSFSEFVSDRRPARLLLSFVSGVLLIFCQAPGPQPLLATISLTPWLLALSGSRSFLDAGIQSVVVSATYGVITIRWLPIALSNLGAAHAHPVFSLPVIAIWVALPAFAAAGIAWYLLRQQAVATRILITAGIFSAVEWLHGSWSLGIPWGQFGYSQIDSPGVSQLAWLGGTPLISAYLVLLNGIAAEVIDAGGRRCARPAACLFASWLALHWLGLPVLRWVESEAVSERSLRVLVSQPNVPRAERWSPDLQAINLERMAIPSLVGLREELNRVDLIVWPENVVTVPIDRDEGLKSQIQNEINRLGIPVVMGIVESAPSGTPNRYQSAAVWWDSSSGILARSDKERAIPVVEAASRSAFERAVSSRFFDEATAFRMETARSGSDLHGFIVVTPLLCWEALFANLTTSRRSRDSRVIINLADNSWTNAAGVGEQLVDIARFRAIEQRLPLVRVAHGGPSVVVDRFGLVISRLPTNQYATSVVDIPPRQHARASSTWALIAIPCLAGLAVWWVWSVGVGIQKVDALSLNSIQTFDTGGRNEKS